MTASLRVVFASTAVFMTFILSYNTLKAGDKTSMAAELAKNLTVDGDNYYIKYADLGTISVQPVRFEPPAGEGFMAVSYRCGLLFGQSDQPSQISQISQMLTTIGIGETELLSCDGLVDLAAIDVNDGGHHIGLIYDLRTPNTSFRAALIVSWREGRWVVDDTLSSEATIPPGTDSLSKLQNVFRDRK